MPMRNQITKQRLKYYEECQGIIVKKYRNLLGQHILIVDANGSNTKIFVGKSLFDFVAVGSQQTIGHIKGQIVNICPGFRL